MSFHTLTATLLTTLLTLCTAIPCLAQTRVTTNEPIEARLASPKDAHEYLLVLEADGVIDATLQSNSFPIHASLSQEGVGIVRISKPYTEFGGEVRYALTAPCEVPVKTLPGVVMPAGVYVIRVESYRQKGVGAYTLTLNSPALKSSVRPKANSHATSRSPRDTPQAESDTIAELQAQLSELRKELQQLRERVQQLEAKRALQ
jgi:hypothetical protein